MHKDERNYVHQSFVATHKPGKCAVSAWSMRRSRNFRQGGPGQSDKKCSDNVFLFLSPQLNLLKSKGYFRRNLSFFKVPEGVQYFPGGGGGGPIAYSL